MSLFDTGNLSLSIIIILDICNKGGPFCSPDVCHSTGMAYAISFPWRYIIFLTNNLFRTLNACFPFHWVYLAHLCLRSYFSKKFVKNIPLYFLKSKHIIAFIVCLGIVRLLGWWCWLVANFLGSMINNIRWMCNLNLLISF